MECQPQACRQSKPQISLWLLSLLGIGRQPGTVYPPAKGMASSGRSSYGTYLLGKGTKQVT